MNGANNKWGAEFLVLRVGPYMGVAFCGGNK